jgi:hypothetical protein
LTLRKRLNEGSENFSFDIVSHQILDDEVIVLGRLTLEGLTKSAFGGTSITRDNTGSAISIGDDLKAAAADALKKAASLFGVGHELYAGKPSIERTVPEMSQPHTNPTNRATVRQMAALQSAARRRGLTQDRLTAMVHTRTGKTDLGQLDRREASNLISELSGTNGTSH